ncbi:ankyrin repeat-containing domain protein [Aspergillus crustosus]
MRSVLVRIDTLDPALRATQLQAAFHQALRDGGAVMMEMLLDTGADFELTYPPFILPPVRQEIPKLSSTPLLFAELGLPDHMNMLLRRGEYINDKNPDGRSALSIAAAREGSTEVLQLLVDHGADLDDTDANGMTALGWAIRENCLEAAKILVAAGCNTSKADFAGKTPLHWARSDALIGTIYSSR